MPQLLKEFANIEYYITTKTDGSSHSISVDENVFHVLLLLRAYTLSG